MIFIIKRINMELIAIILILGIGAIIFQLDIITNLIKTHNENELLRDK